METVYNLTPRERKEKMFEWMVANKLTYKRISEIMGVSSTLVSIMFKRPSIPTRRHKQLRDVGVPLEILPPAKDIPSGPRPKWANEISDAAHA